MIEFKYLKEKARMLKSFGYKDHCTYKMCAQCPLGNLAKGRGGIPCAQVEIEYPEEAEVEVYAWASAHHIRTRKDALLEKLPDVLINAENDPVACAMTLGLATEWDGKKNCQLVDCHECWNAPAEE